MSEQVRTAWTERHSAEVIESVSTAVREALAQGAAGGLTEEQAQRLKEALVGGLGEEAAVDVRLITRRFLDEEKAREKAAEKARRRDKADTETVERLSLHQRVQHMIMFSSCIILIVTGLPIKFHEAAVAAWAMNLMGGPEVTRILHRIGAIGLTFIGFYHIWYTMAFEEGRRDFGKLLPKPQDVKDFFHQMGYFLGLKKDKPLFGRFSYIEKFDYWAVYWGMVVMITSGYILWFKEAAINQFGKYVYDIGREAHSDEALLATLAIVIWHFYNVHFNPHKFPGSLTWWNGKITMKEFKEEHPLEYQEWLEKQKEKPRAAAAASGGEGRP